MANKLKPPRELREFFKTPAARAYFQEEGRRGGKIGGKIRAEKLSKARRQEIAKKAAAARWGKKESFTEKR
jgi:hypothetical protein